MIIMTLLYIFKMYCRSVCEKYKAYKTGETLSYYSQGYKLCKECELFLDWNGIRCPCCNAVLRTKPHNSMSKHKLRLNQSVSMV
jgi:uncharacterized paraquat-inducible protein A